MNLTGKQIVEREIVNGPIDKENIQQHGVDLNVVHIERMTGVGFIPKVGKTQLVDYEEVPIENIDWEDAKTKSLRKGVAVWKLEPGAYSIVFEQGCKIPCNQRLEIVQRSSMLRNGTILKSSLFDAGFRTSNMGTVMFVHHPIVIEIGARIAQAYVTQSNEVEKEHLYAGQYQEDSQRKQK